MKRQSFFLAAPFLCAQAASAYACDLIPFKREPTVEEKVAGLDQIFGGTVVGYQTVDGRRLMGPIPTGCLDELGDFPWWDEAIRKDRQCAAYLETATALFRVDVPIVGPERGQIAAYEMTWGDGAGRGIPFHPGTSEPIRDDEVAALRRMAAKPPFDFSTLY
jgi:hypothetical protein